LLPAPSADSLLVKRKRLGLSKHKIQIEKTEAFAFNKPSSTNLSEFIGIDKPKEVIKKNKPLNKNTEILEFLFEQKIDNNNNNNNNNNKPKSNTDTPPKIISQILAPDSQVTVLNSTPSFHPSPQMVSLSSPAIQSSVIDSNAFTQAFNILETFELLNNPPMFPILSEENSFQNINAISTTSQKNQ
jgi:hypothetical protein